jgi:hypothetical protein
MEESGEGLSQLYPKSVACLFSPLRAWFHRFHGIGDATMIA